MARRRTTQEEQQKIVKMHVEQQMSYSQIAASTGLTSSGVAGILHRHGIRHRDYGGLGGNRKYEFTGAEEELLVAWYSAGRSCEAISQELGIPWLVVNRRLKELGVKLRPGGFRKGKDHHGWKGGRVLHANGYILALVPETDPYYSMAQKKVGTVRYCLEHRLVMARHLGRPLEPHETVHHIDGNRQNNDLSNLQLRQGAHGKGSSFRCCDCGSYNVESTPLTA